MGLGGFLMVEGKKRLYEVLHRREGAVQSAVKGRV